MPRCQWRDHPSDAETCGRMADKDSIYCPRHTFLKEVAAQKKIARGEAKREAGVGRTRQAIVKDGYRLTGQGTCSGCNRLVEWLITPNGRRAPFDLMPNDNSPAVSHFATCSRANSFRRKPA